MPLAITRNAFNHVVLECRSASKCEHTRIVAALGMANEHVYEETPDAWVRRLGSVPVQSVSRSVASPSRGEGEQPGGGIAIANANAQADERGPGTRVGTTAEAGAIIAEPTEGEMAVPGNVTTTGVGAPAGSTGPACRRREHDPWIHRSGEAGSRSRHAEQRLTARPRRRATRNERFREPTRQPGGTCGVRVFRQRRSWREGRSTQLDRGFVTASVERAVVSFGGWAVLCSGSRGRSTRDPWAEVSGVSRLADRRFLIDQPEPPSNWAIRRVIGDARGPRSI